MTDYKNTFGVQRAFWKLIRIRIYFRWPIYQSKLSGLLAELFFWEKTLEKCKSVYSPKNISLIWSQKTRSTLLDSITKTVPVLKLCNCYHQCVHNRKDDQAGSSRRLAVSAMKLQHLFDENAPSSQKVYVAVLYSGREEIERAGLWRLQRLPGS